MRSLELFSPLPFQVSNSVRKAAALMVATLSCNLRHFAAIVIILLPQGCIIIRSAMVHYVYLRAGFQLHNMTVPFQLVQADIQT